MAAFPSYGEFLLDGFGEQPESPLVRTNMESGPVKQAKLRSKIRVVRNVTYRFTNAEYVTWKTWHKTTVAFGALWFDWINPLDGATVQGRIINGLYNAISFDGGDGTLKWDVGFALETYE